MRHPSELVKMANDACNRCTSLRQEKVKLVRISSWLSCPFLEHTGARTHPSPSCLAFNGPRECTNAKDLELNGKCPLLDDPLYHDGEIVMLVGVRYRNERR